MTLPSIIREVEGFFLLYLSLMSLGYVVLNISALAFLQRYLRSSARKRFAAAYGGFEPGLSVVVPFYNSRSTIVMTLTNLLNQRYPLLQVILVNDGSTDDSLQDVLRALQMERIDLPPCIEFDAKPIRAVYRATGGQDVLLIDKENGRKADALNAGLQFARYDLICTMDDDSLLMQNTLCDVAHLFMTDSRMVAAGASVMVLNGSSIDDRCFPQMYALTNSYWVNIQTIEYVRGFLIGRLGWLFWNAVPLLSGTCAFFTREALSGVGGFRTDTVGEDLDITLRIHEWGRKTRRSYRIGFLPEPMCWTEVPNDFWVLQNQRIRWHRGLSESFRLQSRLIAGGGTIGLVTMPFVFVFELIAPVVELLGYAFTILGFAIGVLSHQALLAFLFLAIGLRIVMSLGALLIAEFAFNSFPRFRQVLTLAAYAFVECIGYWQLHAMWRVLGIAEGLRKGRSVWRN